MSRAEPDLHLISSPTLTIAVPDLRWGMQLCLSSFCPDFSLAHSSPTSDRIGIGIFPEGDISWKALHVGTYSLSNARLA